jgi:MFS family permease
MMNAAKWSSQHYRNLWVWLLLGWVVSSADRSITGPVITWMIENHIDFLGASSHPHSLGGLVGSLFFAGYMLTQFPGGYLGDKFGHRTIIVISILWAGITTLMSGLVTGLIGFIALRVITGLGVGVYYSNDRTLIAEMTPFVISLSDSMGKHGAGQWEWMANAFLRAGDCHLICGNGVVSIFQPSKSGTSLSFRTRSVIEIFCYIPCCHHACLLSF